MDSQFMSAVLPQLRDAVAQGRVLFVIGPGFSASAGIPRFDYLLSAGSKEQLVNKRTSISTVAADAYAKLNRLNAKVPEAYRLIAELPVSTVVSTNYDELLEKAFASVGKRVEVTLTAWDIQKPTLRSDEVMLIKLHGDLSAPALLETSSRITDETNSPWRMLLQRCTQLFEYDFEVFLGFGANDSSELTQVLSGLGTSRARTQRVLLTSHKKFAEPSVLRGLTHVQRTSHAELSDFLRKLGKGAQSRSISGPVLRSSLENCIRQYLRSLQRDLRHSWTIDQTKRLTIEEVPFRIDVQERDEFKGLSEEPTDRAVKSTIAPLWSTSAHFAENLLRKRRILIVGEAGCGKTTFLRSMARSLARPVEPTIVPLFLNAQDLHRCPIESMESILKSLELRAGIPGLASATKSALENRSCVFFIDALDELEPSAANSVMNILHEYCLDRPKLRYVASCRPHLFRDFVQADLDAVVHLAPLDQEQIGDFLDCWFGGKAESASLRRLVVSQPQVLELARRPLFLQMLAYLWGTEQTAPISVAGLYESAVRLLFGRWDVEHGVFRDSHYDQDVKSRVLVAVAVFALRNERHVMSTNDVVQILCNYQDIGTRSASEAIAIAEEIEKQSGLFGRVDDDHWSFAHSGFADYFCSRFVVESSPNTVAEVIATSENSRRWIPVLAMAGSALNADEADSLLKALASRVRSLGRHRDICIQAQQQRNLKRETVSNELELSKASNFGNG